MVQEQDKNMFSLHNMKMKRAFILEFLLYLRMDQGLSPKF